MCLLIVSNSGKVLSKELFTRASVLHPHGMGMAYFNTTTKQILIHKELSDVEKFYEEYKKAFEGHGATSLFMVHFRKSSRGTVSLDNVHPFIGANGVVVAHNGTITGLADGDMSDTAIAVRDVLGVLPVGKKGEEFTDNAAYTTLIRSYIGQSRIACFMPSGDVMIYNHDQGFEVDGIWYSNETYKEDYKPPVTASYEYGGAVPTFGGSYYRNTKYDYDDYDNSYSAYDQNPIKSNILKTDMCLHCYGWYYLNEFVAHDGARMCKTCAAKYSKQNGKVGVT